MPGSIDQVDGFLDFNHDDEDKIFDGMILEACQLAEDIHKEFFAD